MQQPEKPTYESLAMYPVFKNDIFSFPSDRKYGVFRIQDTTLSMQLSDGTMGFSVTAAEIKKITFCTAIDNEPVSGPAERANIYLRNGKSFWITLLASPSANSPQPTLTLDQVAKALAEKLKNPQGNALSSSFYPVGNVDFSLTLIQWVAANNVRYNKHSGLWLIGIVAIIVIYIIIQFYRYG